MPSPRENLELMLAELPPGVKRAPFAVLCGAYYALHRGFPPTQVAKAFGFSIATACNLRDCLRDRGDYKAHRYARVANEFMRLGEEAFADAYYTADIDDRLARIRIASDRTRSIDKRGAVLEPGDVRFPPRARTSKWDGVEFPVERHDRSEIVTLIIGWRNEGEDLDPEDNPLPAGWTFRCLDGDENELRWSSKRFRTGDEAHRAAIYGYGFEVKSGS